MKLLLEYEDVALHLQYNAKKEFFSNSVYPPNPECKDPHCLERQKQKAGKLGFLGERKASLAEKNKPKEKPVSENKAEFDKWGIELVEPGKEEKTSDTTSHTIGSKETEGQSVDDLMSQLNQL